MSRGKVSSPPEQIDPQAWVYDIGENSDCSVDALVCDNVADLIATFRQLPTAKASFATKFVTVDCSSWTRKAVPASGFP
jgi:hypothetical protein